MPDDKQLATIANQSNISLKDQVINTLLDKLKDHQDFDKELLDELKQLNDEGQFSDKDEIKEILSL